MVFALTALAGCGWLSESQHAVQQLPAPHSAVAALDDAVDFALAHHEVPAQENGVTPAALTGMSGGLDQVEIYALARRMGFSDIEQARSLRDETFRTFPVIADLVIRSRDHQIDDGEWQNFAEGFTPGLVRLFDLPVEIHDPQNKARLHQLRGRALAAAIIAQLHLDYHAHGASRNMPKNPLIPAAFNREIKVKIPFARKISGKNSDMPLTVAESRLIHMSGRQVRSLLEAPISAP